MIRPLVAASTLALLSVLAGSGCDFLGSRRDRESLPETKPSVPSSRDQADSNPGAELVAEEPESKRVQELDSINELIEQGRMREASQALRSGLVADPSNVEMIFLLANVEAAQGSLAAAIELLDGIPRDHPEAGVPALGQSADWCLELGRFEDAEERYREVLRWFPDAFPARRQLAWLLNRQGRRHEAAEQVRELCRIGNVRQDELHSLIMVGHAMHDDPAVASSDPQQVLYTPIGAGGEARKLFTDGRFSEAADALESWVANGKAPPSIAALYGRATVEAQDDLRFTKWLSRVDDATRQTADYWAALGTYLISQRRFQEATRALLEAADRDPTDFYSFGRLGQTLLTLGDAQASQRWLDRWDEMNELIKANNRVSETSPPDPDQIDALIVLLEKLQRPLEALLWKAIADHHRGAPIDQRMADNERLKALVASGDGFADAEGRLCDLDLQAFPLPSLSDLAENRVLPAKQSPRPAGSATPARFQNLAATLGINHAYQVAAQPQAEGFAIYQTYGGAVAVLDYDLDGRSDLYFAQGGSDPPTFRGNQSNQLFRNELVVSGRLLPGGDGRAGDDRELPSGSFADVTSDAGANDFRYSLGVTAGDWNQDGFPDLVVANLGEDSLLINNGDGTFTYYAIVAPDDQYRVPTSVAMADLDGDSLPDIFELAYVDDPTMIFLPKRNEARQVIKAMSPMQYAPGPDRICFNDGRGGMKIERFNTDETDFRAGLGLVITDFNQRPGNEIFVGNDLYPDQLWVRDPESGSWSDIAPAVGCAFGIRGSKTASMGIAVGDVDNNGTIDIHITNYQNRNSSLFLNLGESFLEKNVQYGLAEASLSVLGFGTQGVDYNNDGLLDLVVTNGHIEKAITIDEPFEQPAQLFANRSGRFELIPVEDPSGYWAGKHLGRGLARVDLDRDGRNDVVITHLGEPSAVLLNRTVTDNHWLQVQLVGVESERDAIGAKVTIQSERGELHGWVTAGDGYLSRNEPVLSFGLGDAGGTVRLQIHWPSGTVEQIDRIVPDHRVLVIEGRTEAFAMP